MEPRKIRLTLSLQAEKYVRRDAPVGVRRMAARGALALEPIDLATVLFALQHDPDPEVKERAKQSLDELPEHILQPVLTGRTHPALLAYLAHVHSNDQSCCEAIALNPAAEDRLIAFLAELPHSRVVDIISNNQQRMLRCEEIVDALGSNPLTGRAVIQRILSFLGSAADNDDDLADDEEIDQEQAEAAVLAIIGNDIPELARYLTSEGDTEIDDEEIQKNLYAAIQKMSVLQKIKLARLGGVEARGLLIRDRNKIVATSVISSPKVADTEAIGYAKSRNVCDEVLRLIAAKKEWTRNYQVKLALATNPRCPQASAVRFLNYLQDRDLKAAMKSKDVPAAVSAHARRILQKKGKI